MGVSRLGAWTDCGGSRLGPGAWTDCGGIQIVGVSILWARDRLWEYPQCGSIQIVGDLYFGGIQIVMRESRFSCGGKHFHLHYASHLQLSYQLKIISLFLVNCIAL